MFMNIFNGKNVFKGFDPLPLHQNTLLTRYIWSITKVSSKKFVPVSPHSVEYEYHFPAPWISNSRWQFLIFDSLIGKHGYLPGFKLCFTSYSWVFKNNVFYWLGLFISFVFLLTCMWFSYNHSSYSKICYICSLSVFWAFLIC